MSDPLDSLASLHPETPRADTHTGFGVRVVLALGLLLAAAVLLQPFYPALEAFYASVDLNALFAPGSAVTPQQAALERLAFTVIESALLDAVMRMAPVFSVASLVIGAAVSVTRLSPAPAVVGIAFAALYCWLPELFTLFALTTSELQL